MSSEGKKGRGKIEKKAHALLAAATVLGCVLYLVWPHAGFVFDDPVTILHNRMVQESPIFSVRENPFRAVVNLTFWLQHRLHRPAFAPMTIAAARPRITGRGERLRPFYLDPATGAAVPVTIDRDQGMVYPLPPSWPFHLFNLGLHLLNGWLLFYILRRLRTADLLAAACAAAFILHPLATEPVNYITARFALMALAFSLAAALAHLRADGRGKGELIALGFYILALFSKETAAGLPLMLFVLDLARGRVRPLCLAGLGVLAAYAAARSQWLVVLGMRPGEVLDWPLYLLAQQRVFWLYLDKVLLPVRLNFDYFLRSRPGLDAAFAALNLVILTAASIRLLQILARLRAAPARPGAEGKRRPEARAFGTVAAPAGAAAIVLLCFIALAPTSSFIPLADLAREDRAYPLLAILIPAAGLGLARFLAATPRLRRPALITAAAALCLLAAGTAARNSAWQTELTLNTAIVRQSPEKPRAVYNYATALKWRGRLDEALHWYEFTLALDPAYQDARINADTLRRLRGESARGQPGRPSPPTPSPW